MSGDPYDAAVAEARSGCYCAPYSKPCPEHQAWADGYEHAQIDLAASGGADQEDAALACAVALTHLVGLKQGSRDHHYDEQKPLAWAAAEAAARAFYLAHRDLYQDPRCPSCRQPLGITGIRRGVCDTHGCDRYMTEVYDDGPAFAIPGAPSTDPAPEPPTCSNCGTPLDRPHAPMGLGACYLGEPADPAPEPGAAT